MKPKTKEYWRRGRTEVELKMKQSRSLAEVNPKIDKILFEAENDPFTWKTEYDPKTTWSWNKAKLNKTNRSQIVGETKMKLNQTRKEAEAKSNLAHGFG